MDKKYLLYIHSPKFKKEKKKSALVNELLDAYYSMPKEVRVVLARDDLIQKSLPQLGDVLRERSQSTPDDEINYIEMVD